MGEEEVEDEVEEVEVEGVVEEVDGETKWHPIIHNASCVAGNKHMQRLRHLIGVGCLIMARIL